MRILGLLGIAGLIAALAPAAAAQVASRCVTNCNYWVTGKRIAGSGEDAASAGACQARCNANAACHGWMFWLPSNGMHPNMCELVGSGASTDYKPSSLAFVSGLKSRAAAPGSTAAAPQGAARRTSTFVRDHLWDTTNTGVYAGTPESSNSAQACMTGCIRDLKCKAWVYMGQTSAPKCYFIPDPKRLVKHAAGNDYVAGAIRAAAPSAAAPQGTAATPPAGAPVRTSSWLPGKVIGLPNQRVDNNFKLKTATTQECRRLCLSNQRCAAWDHQVKPWREGAESGICRLFRSFGAPDDNSLYIAGIVKTVPGAAAPPPGTSTTPPGIPSDPRQALAAGREAAGRADYQRAAELFTAALNSGKLDPASRLQALKSRASALFNLKRYDQARADYDAVINAAPNDSDALWGRAFLLYAIGQGEAAMDDAERAVKANPRNHAAYSMRAVLRQAKGNHDGAIADFTQVIALMPDARNKARQHLIRARAYREAGRIDEGLKDLGLAIVLWPDFTDALRWRGVFRNQAGRFDEAWADFDRVLAREPNNRSALFGRAVAEVHRDRFAEAVKDLTRYTDAVPSDHYGHIMRYLLRERIGEWAWPDLARAAARLDLKKWPAPAVHHLLGNLGAEAFLAAAKHDDPKTARGQVCEAEFYIGQAALLSGDKAGARQRFERAVAVCPPNFVEATWAKAELARPASQP